MAKLEQKGFHKDSCFIGRATIGGTTIKSKPNNWVMMSADIMVALGRSPTGAILTDNDASYLDKLGILAGSVQMERVAHHLAAVGEISLTYDEDSELVEIAMVPDWVKTREHALSLRTLELFTRKLIVQALDESHKSLKFTSKFTEINYQGKAIAWMTAPILGDELIIYLRNLPPDSSYENLIVDEIEPEVWWPGGIETRFRIHIPDESAAIASVAILRAVADGGS